MPGSSDQRVFLNGYIDVPSERLASVRDALPNHIALTRAEDGCLSFEVIEDTAHPGRFTVAEVFESQEAFEKHQTRTKASDWFRVTEGISRHYEITRASD